MRVQHTPDVFTGDQFGQFAFDREFDLKSGFAQLRRDERQTKRRIDFFFCRTCEDSFPVAQSVRIEASADLITWQTLSTTNLPNGAVIQFTDPQAPNSLFRFYRAVSP